MKNGEIITTMHRNEYGFQLLNSVQQNSRMRNKVETENQKKKLLS